MANIKSQKKRILTNAKATERNRAIKSELRTLSRATREAVAAGDAGKAEQAFAAVSKKLDKAVTKGVLHKNTAANRKSKLAHQLASVSN